jgi:uncharacterized membrane protein YbhN (UPF0104 family)
MRHLRCRSWPASSWPGSGRSRSAAASAWTAGAADICAFYGGLRTFGLVPSPGKVILAYATGYAATRRSLPLGGAGLTEVMMTYSLYWVRLPLAPSLGAVVAYRLFNLLLAAMLGLIANHQLERELATVGEARARRRYRAGFRRGRSP